MPALVVSSLKAESETMVAPTFLTKKQVSINNNDILSSNVFTIPELCDLIASHLSLHELAITVRVSSQWYRHFIRHLWKRVTLASTPTSLRILALLPELGHHIRTLDWANLTPHWNMKQALAGIDLSSLALQHLHLLNCQTLQGPELEQLIQSSSLQLNTLQMHNIGKVQGNVLRIASTLPQLQHLTLVMDDDTTCRHNRSQPVTPASAPMVQSPGGLGSHSGEEEEEDSTVTFEITSADSLPALLDACPRLHTIELIGLPSALSTDQGKDIQDQEVEQDGDEEVVISGSNKNNIMVLESSMRYLTSINLHSTALSGSTLSTIFARCNLLVKLDISQTSPLFLSGFHLDTSTILPDLGTLMLSGCHFLDGHGFKELFRATPQVLTLELSDTNIDNTGLAALGRFCPQVLDLGINNCHQITDQGVRDYLCYPPQDNNNNNDFGMEAAAIEQEPYRNYTLHSLSISNCSELTGQGIQHVLTTCAALRSLAFQQPEIMPESMFPHVLQSADDEEEETESQGQENINNSSAEEEEAGAEDTPETTTTTTTTTITTTDSSSSWACHKTLELLRIKNLDTVNPAQRQYLNARLRELAQLRVLHIGGRQLELSVLDGLGHRLEHLYIDDLKREVDLQDVQWLVDHTPNLTRLWCRQLIRHSEPWKVLRGARKGLKLW
ncbi:hypothetical protein BGZ93_008182 [Podila epicladia]|nr:hypothetical protein BGZ92_008279 [Podila epicladia]KAG0092760.1 hypothetical protein BGZ93_008182 [Podila epicladia]